MRFLSLYCPAMDAVSRLGSWWPDAIIAFKMAGLVLIARAPTGDKIIRRRRNDVVIVSWL
jgi:hypothetical protein